MPTSISVNVTDTFEQWRQKTNQLGVDVFDAIRNIDEDTSPSLGGDLNLTSTTGNAPGSYDIIGVGNIDIDGDITCTGALTSGTFSVDAQGTFVAGNFSVSGVTELITGAGGLTLPKFTVDNATGDIGSDHFDVSGTTGSVTGSNWSIDGATGDITAAGGLTLPKFTVDHTTGDIGSDNFDVDGATGTVTGTNWSVNGATGVITALALSTTHFTVDVTNGDIDSNHFDVDGTTGSVTGSNWSIDGATGDITGGGDMTITGDYTGTTFLGALDGTISSATQAITQTLGDNDVKVATTAYVDGTISNLALTVDALDDTTIVNPIQQHLLMYDAATSKWINQSILSAGVPSTSFTVAMAVALGY